MIAAKQEIASLMQALHLYRLDNQRYPLTEQEKYNENIPSVIQFSAVFVVIPASAQQYARAGVGDSKTDSHKTYTSQMAC